MDPLNSQDVKVTPQGASIRIFRLWQSILVIGGHCWDLWFGFRLWPHVIAPGRRAARMGTARLGHHCAIPLLVDPGLDSSLG